MGVKEIIEGLKRLFSEKELDLPNTDSLEILNVTVEMLEKQNEKQLLPLNDSSLIYKGLCPICKKSILMVEKYCSHCGQKIL